MALLAGAIVLVYAPVSGYGFLLYEDGAYVSRNPLVTGGLSLRTLAAAVTSFHAAVWLPATWVSHMLDWSMFGGNAGLHHGMNVALHAVASMFLFEWLRRATGRPVLALASAALFALHPLRVEPVAWIASRKDVLSGVFLFATLIAWDRWVRAPTRGRYAAALVAYAFGLASKSSLVPLPLALLALDAWPYGRWRDAGGPRARLLEKLPFAVLAAGAAGLTLAAATSGGATTDVGTTSVAGRLSNAAVSVVAYLSSLIWPVGLDVHYPYEPWLPTWLWVGALASFAAISCVALLVRHRAPWVGAGWAWYVVMVAPTLGVVQVGSQARADRFTYLPMIGVTWAIVWTIDAAVRGRARLAAAIATVVACASLAVLSARQLRTWKDDETLFRHALAVEGPNPFAQYNLANALRVRADAAARTPARAQVAPLLQEAQQLYRAAVEGRPLFAEAHYNLANLLADTDRLSEATHHYELAVRARPFEPRMRNNLGVALARLGRVREARAQFEEAVRLDPGFSDARRNLEIAARSP